MLNRKGIVKVHKDLFYEEEGLMASHSVFSKFTPMFITEDFNGKFYHGISKDFDEVKEGDPIPYYDAQVTRSFDKKNEGKPKSVYNCIFIKL